MPIPSNQELLSQCDQEVRSGLGEFIKEFNKREYLVRIEGSHTFDTYASEVYEPRPDHGFGWVVDGRPVPYFHPNRSFHDEIIWLNNNLFYDTRVSFKNRLLNAAIVKFYGPSRTLDIITGEADDLPYLTPTGKNFVDFDLIEDREYARSVMGNIEVAFRKKEKIWGTTELRTSLQKASRDWARRHPSPVDIDPIADPTTGKIIEWPSGPDRPMRPSDMIHWISSLSGLMNDFYSEKPSMKESFEFLTSFKGIGNYYGYHFSSNLARMPGVGSPELILAEHSDRFDKLGVDHGRIDENADYVVAGPGATATLARLWPQYSMSQPNMSKMILAIRDNQEEFFGISGEDQKILSSVTELGRFTTFGIEISCCQYNVFERIKHNQSMASNRAAAPISMEVGKTSVTLENFFS